VPLLLHNNRLNIVVNLFAVFIVTSDLTLKELACVMGLVFGG